MEPLQFDEQNQVILPQPDEIPEKDKMDASGAYVMMFASSYLPLPLVNLLAAFIYHMACRKRSRFVAFHTYQSFVSQIPSSISLWALIVWLIYILVKYNPSAPQLFTSITFLSILSIVLVWNLTYTIVSIVALVRARKGRFCYLPLFGKHAFNRYFGPNAIHPAIPPSAHSVNRPPDN
jgi:uncharacterized Tic20 family protein